VCERTSQEERITGPVQFSSSKARPRTCLPQLDSIDPARPPLTDTRPTPTFAAMLPTRPRCLPSRYPPDPVARRHATHPTSMPAVMLLTRPRCSPSHHPCDSRSSTTRDSRPGPPTSLRYCFTTARYVLMPQQEGRIPVPTDSNRLNNLNSPAVLPIDISISRLLSLPYLHKSRGCQIYSYPLFPRTIARAAGSQARASPLEKRAQPWPSQLPPSRALPPVLLSTLACNVGKHR
jgi:hypothetical protein